MEARQRFTELLSSGHGNDTAQLYLADIAARDGRSGGSDRGVRAALYDSPVALSARSARRGAAARSQRARRGAGVAR